MKRNLLIVIPALVISLTACNSGSSSSSQSQNDETSTTVLSAALTPCPPSDGSAERTLDFNAGFQDCLTQGKKYTATFDTTEGTVVVDLDTTKTPKTTNNFIGLPRSHYYDGTTIFGPMQASTLFKVGRRTQKVRPTMVRATRSKTKATLTNTPKATS